MAGTFSGILFLAEAADWEKPGYACGAAVPFILTLVGIAKCAQIMRRPTTNTKGVLALMILLIGWFAAMTSGAAKDFLEGQARQLILIAGGLLTFVCSVVGIVLAVIAITEIRTQVGRYNQGMRQAVWALILCVAMVGLGGFGFYRGIKQRDKAESAEIAKLATPVQPAANQTLRFDKFNFTFDMPPKPWVQTDMKRLAPDACLTMMRSRPQIAMQIIAENGAGVLDIPVETLAEVSIGNLKATANESRVIEQKPHRINGIDGIRIYSDASVNGLPFSYVHWVAAVGGNAYQLIVCGRPQDKTEVRAAAEDLFARFHVSDTTKVASAAPTISDHRSDRYGYSIRLPGGAWRPWHVKPEEQPLADFGALSGADVCVAVYPLSLLGADPSLDALFTALLSQLDVKPHDARDKRPLTLLDGNEGFAASFRRDVSGKMYDYRMRVIKRKGFAYLAAGWTSTPSKLRLVEDSIDTFTCEPTLPAGLGRARLDARERKGHATVFNELGLHEYEASRPAVAAPLFALSLELREDPVVAENAALAYAEAGRAKEALPIIEPMVRKYPDRILLRARLANLYDSAGNAPEAIGQYAILFSATPPPASETYMQRYLVLLMDAERYDDGLAACARYLRYHDSPWVARNQAQLHFRKGDPDRAAKLLLDRLAERGFDVDVARVAAMYQIKGGHYTEALSTLDRVIAAKGGDTAEAYSLRSDAEVGLKRYRDAKASLELAARRAPSDQDIAASLRDVSALLGEGDNSTIKTPVEPVEIPAEFTSAPDGVSTADAEAANAYYLSRVTAISYLKGKEYRQTEYRRVKVLSAAGVDAFTSLQFSFDPVVEQIYVNRVEVRDERGKVVAAGRVSDYYVTDRKTGDVPSFAKELNVTVPGLKPGHEVEVVVTKRDLRPPDVMPFTEHVFYASSPALRRTLLVRGDVVGLRHEASAGVKQGAIDGGIAWSVTPAAAYRYEPWQAPLREFTPYVLVGEAGATWDGEAKSYLATIAEVLKPEPDVEALARRLTEGLKSDAERIEALVRHVQGEYAYKAVAFGRRARIPQKANDVIRNRFGDCKDHSLLLRQLLRAAGYPAHLALVRSDGTLDVKLPSLDQFNHMIVYAPLVGEGGSFFDCTDKYAMLAPGAPPWGLGGGQALVLDEQAPRVVSIRAYPNDSSELSTDRTLTITPDGDVIVSEVATFRGYRATAVREDLNSWNARDREDVVRRWLIDPSLDMTIDRVGIRDLGDRAKPLVLELGYTVRGRFAMQGGQRVGALPAIIERDYLGTPQSARRTTPFRLATPFIFRANLTINLPEGSRVADAPADRKSDDALSPYSIDWTNDGKSLRAQFLLRSPMGTYPPTEYARFEQLRRQAIASIEPSLVLVPSK
jgi:transglutaminase-like putative cysteine protease/tetratricopeptide (TPR) repeat protein